MKPGEARRNAPARQKLAELALDEPRQALAVAQRGRLRTERLEMIANELMKLTLHTIARRRRGTASAHGARTPTAHAVRSRDDFSRNRGVASSAMAFSATPATPVDRNL